MANDPNTSVRGGVRTTMNQPVGKSVSPGGDEGNNTCGAPFDAAHPTGGGGIPTHVYEEDMPATAARTIAPALASPDANSPSVGASRRAPLKE